MIGSTISHYKILEKLGGGGMGVVYKARDLKLDRTVALKFLHPDLTRDPDSRGRFVVEARTASGLRHANICVIHDIDETDDRSSPPEAVAGGQMFIVMEYLEGETLKTKIEGGPLKIDEAIDIAVQIASGLTRAHESGIIHRDIKPANIMIGPRGEITILDFGIAKLTGGDRRTRTGPPLGTISYMSPEQLRAENLDHRTDIWSLGIILFEMLTGSTPFGDYQPVLVHFILNEAPPEMNSKRGPIPDEVQRIVLKCLEKHPADRYQSLADLIVDLRRFKRASDISGRLPTARFEGRSTGFNRFSKRTRLTLAIVAGGVVVIVVASFLSREVFFPHRSAGESTKRELEWFTKRTGISDFPDWSPGNMGIVFSSTVDGSMDLWKQRSSSSDPVRLTSSSANETYPAWSPDGKTIAFCTDSAGGMVMAISSEGGPPTPIAPLQARPRWSPDGKQLSLDWKYAIYIVDFPPRGVPVQIVPPTTAEPTTVWSGDGRHLIFWDRVQGDICVVPVEGGEATSMNVIPNGEEVTGMSCSRDGKSLIICRGQFGGPKELWRLQLDAETCQPLEEAVQIHLSTDDIVRCSLSPDGTQLAFTGRSVDRCLYEITLDPVTGLAKSPPALLTSERGLNYYPGLSRDGDQLVWTHQEANRAFLFVQELPTGQVRKVTPDIGQEGGHRQVRELGGAFSPRDGSILFTRTPERGFALWSIQAPGAPFAVKITETQERQRDVHPSISPDGSKVLFYSNRCANWDIYMFRRTDESQLRQLTRDSTNELYPAWSKSGHQIAFCTDRDRSFDIWIMDSSGLNPRPFVQWPSDECWPVWSADDGKLYYVSNRSGFFNIWMKDFRSGECQHITKFASLLYGLPETGTYTKFAVEKNRLVFPIESRSANIHVLSNPL